MYLYVYLLIHLATTQPSVDVGYSILGAQFYHLSKKSSNVKSDLDQQTPVYPWQQHETRTEHGKADHIENSIIYRARRLIEYLSLATAMN